MNRGYLIIILALPSLALAGGGWKIPDNIDRESSCRTLAFEAAKKNASINDILVLNAAYKILCEEQPIEAISEYTSYFEGYKASPDYKNKVACFDTSGFVTPPTGSPSGWNHMELDDIRKLYKEFGSDSGWRHDRVQTIIELSPFVRDVNMNELEKLIDISKRGLTSTDISNAVMLKNMENFKQIQPKMIDIDNRINSLNLNQVHSAPQIGDLGSGE